MIVFGIDPGLATFGVAIVELLPTTERVISIEALTTKRSAKKLGILVADDDIARVRFLLEALGQRIGRWHPVALCSELPAGSKGARAAAALGIGKAIVAALSVHHGIPIASCSPQALKKAVAGAQNASKEDVQAALTRRYPSLTWPKNKGDHEHAADALGAVVTCLPSDVIRMARVMSANGAQQQSIGGAV